LLVKRHNNGYAAQSAEATTTVQVSDTTMLNQGTKAGPTRTSYTFFSPSFSAVVGLPCSSAVAGCCHLQQK
jgi:hypothetical protein